MKLTKSDLKRVVKECLIEILNEGLGTSSLPTSKQQFNAPVFLEGAKNNLSQNLRKTPTPYLNEIIKKESGGNKIMESILADTAASTLPKMLGSEQKGYIPQAHGIAEQLVSSTDPEQLFGEEAASKWANLAFMGPSSKK